MTEKLKVFATVDTKPTLYVFQICGVNHIAYVNDKRDAMKLTLEVAEKWLEILTTLSKLKLVLEDANE